MSREGVDVLDSFDYAEYKITTRGAENELRTDFS
jgi:hypothetical protein